MESHNIRFYKGLFSIVLIATLMTIFELFFYIFIVNPNVIFFVNQLIETQPQKEVDERLENLLIVLKEREYNLINEINIGAYIVIIIEIVLMLSFLSFIYMKLLNKHEEFQMRDVYYSSFATIFILISFQIMFFYFGKEFYYIGRFGTNEIKKIFADVY